MLSCVIPGCCSSTKNCNLSFFEIPARYALREKWIQIISNLKQEKNQPPWTTSDRDVVCSKHFCLQDFQNNKNKKMLNHNAVPSVFSNYPETLAPVYKKNSSINDITIDKPMKVPVSIATFCRLCGTKENEVISIFDDEAVKRDVPNLIRMYLPIEVSRNDPRSSSICYECISALMTWNVIYQQSLYVDRELHSMLQSIIQKDNSQVDPPSEVNFVDITNELDVPIEPQVQIIEENNPVVDHPKEDTPVAEKDEDPLFIDPSLDYLVLEEEKENSEANAPLSPIVENNIDEPSTSKTSTEKHEKTFNYSVVRLYKCNICNDISRTQEEFRGHRATHRSTKSYTCNVCGTTFNLKKVMESHIRNIHSFRKRRNGKEDLSQRTCFHCVRKFVNKPTLGTHLKSIHCDGQSYICDICEHKFQELVDFKKHVEETNHRTDGFISKQCEFCGLDFESRVRLRTHVASKHEGGLKCTICDITLRNYLERQDHEAIHPHLRPYKCEFCGKNFKRSCDYKKHLLIHSGERPHVCEVCGKNFNRKHNMEQHRRSHYGDKPFSCPQCRMSFFRVGDLRKHKQLHYLKNQANS